MKPNQFSDEDMARWLSDLDGQVYRDVILTHLPHVPHKPVIYPLVKIWHGKKHKKHHHEHPVTVPPYVLPKDAAQKLLIPFPYQDAYIKYLTAQVDYHNGEFDRYNNAMMMFNTIYQQFADWYNRAHIPRQDNIVVT